MKVELKNRDDELKESVLSCSKFCTIWHHVQEYINANRSMNIKHFSHFTSDWPVAGFTSHHFTLWQWQKCEVGLDSSQSNENKLSNAFQINKLHRKIRSLSFCTSHKYIRFIFGWMCSALDTDYTGYWLNGKAFNSNSKNMYRREREKRKESILNNCFACTKLCMYIWIFEWVFSLVLNSMSEFLSAIFAFGRNSLHRHPYLHIYLFI